MYQYSPKTFQTVIREPGTQFSLRVLLDEVGIGNSVVIIPIGRFTQAAPPKGIVWAGTKQDPLLGFQIPVHGIKLDMKYAYAQCVFEYENVDEKGNLLRDVKTGRALNDGSCPYCYLANLYHHFHANKVMVLDGQSQVDQKNNKRIKRNSSDRIPIKPSLLYHYLQVAIIDPVSKSFNIGMLKLTEYRYSQLSKPIEETDKPELGFKGIVVHFPVPKSWKGTWPRLIGGRSKMSIAKNTEYSSVDSPGSDRKYLDIYTQALPAVKQYVETHEQELIDVTVLNPILEIKTIEEIENELTFEYIDLDLMADMKTEDNLKGLYKRLLEQTFSKADADEYAKRYFNVSTDSLLRVSDKLTKEG